MTLYHYIGIASSVIVGIIGLLTWGVSFGVLLQKIRRQGDDIIEQKERAEKLEKKLSNGLSSRVSALESEKKVQDVRLGNIDSKTDTIDKKLNTVVEQLAHLCTEVSGMRKVCNERYRPHNRRVEDTQE